MRTLLHVGIASLVVAVATPALANHRGHATRTERQVIVVDGQAEQDADVYRSAADRYTTEAEYRSHYDANDPRSYEERRAEWEARDSNYHDQDAEWHARDGEWHEGDARSSRSGDYDRERHRNTRVTRYSDADLARMCRRDDGVGGGLIGGVVGGVVGNRVAGRGNRTVGTILGAGVGAVAGAVIDRAEDRNACRDYWQRVEGGRYHDRSGGYDVRYQGDGRYAGGERYQSGGYYEEERYASAGYGYDYVQGSPTTIVIPGQPVIIEETITEYETVTVATPRARVVPRRPAVRRPVVRRPRCTCR